MRRNSMDFAWNQHTKLDADCVYRNCSVAVVQMTKLKQSA